MFRGILTLIRETPTLEAACRGADRRGTPLILGPSDTAASFVVAALLADSHPAAQHALIVTPHHDAAMRCADDLRSLLGGLDIDVWLYEHSAATRDRLRCLDALRGPHAAVVVAGVGAAIHQHQGAHALGADGGQVDAGGGTKRMPDQAELRQAESLGQGQHVVAVGIPLGLASALRPGTMCSTTARSAASFSSGSPTDRVRPSAITER